MKPITVNSISNKYEQLYKTFLENSSADECFYAVNNAMIFAYFVNYISTSYSKETQDQCYEEIVEKYGRLQQYIEVSCRNTVDVFHSETEM